tara:strand:- start:23168 stop:23536 length:369 start_codon:yes stop_codon:yes gene_type:complete
MNKLERIKQAYQTISRAMTDTTIEDVAQSLGIPLTKLEIQQLEHWALLFKFDNAITDLINLRQTMNVTLREIANIQSGLFQAQQIAFKTFDLNDVQREILDTTPPPNPFCSDDHPPPRDTTK